MSRYLTDDHFYCRDCLETARAIYVEKPERISCAHCDSENVITEGERRHALTLEYMAFMDRWDAEAEARYGQSVDATPSEPSPINFRVRQAS